MKNVIGIDLGGTNVRVAKINENGEILQELKSPSYGLEGPEVVVPNLVNLIKQIDDYKNCAGIGIGVPGPVDTVNKIMTLSSNLTGFTNYPMAKMLEEATGLDVYIDNDANVAGLAEALVGAGKGDPIVYYTTVSTGIGGAMVINGKLMSGRAGYAGEVGNLIVDHTRESFNNLNKGATESEASGRAITRKGQQIFGDCIESAGDVFKLYAENDPQAIELVDQVCMDLAIMFSHVAHIVDPNCFVIGGGMLKSKEIWFDKMIANYKTLVHPGMADIPFRTALLDEPGIVGAAMLPISFGK